MEFEETKDLANRSLQIDDRSGSVDPPGAETVSISSDK